MMMSQIRDMIMLTVRKHGMRLPRAQAAQHQTPEKHLGCKWWVCIFRERKVGDRPTQLGQICSFSPNSPSQTPGLPELVKAMPLKRLTIMHMLARQPCGDKGLGRGRAHPCGNAKAHIRLSQFLQIPKISFQRNPVILPFLCFLSLTEVDESHNMTPTQLPHFLYHDLQWNNITAT